MPSLLDRLMSKLVWNGDEDECWEFEGAMAKGYGRIKVNGAVLQAHRFAYELIVGPIPDGLFALHRCDNRRCCNPAHLFLGDQQANIDDMRQKGRGYDLPPLRGEAHGESRLTEQDVLAIRARSSEPNAALAREFGVSDSLVNLILKRKAWVHI